jgi:glycosyltransferase involved in cell wall biosynthesis
MSTGDRECTKIALVHDFLLDVRGAERVFLELCDIWPRAELFTAVYDEDATEGRFASRTIHSSFLQHLRPSARTFRTLLPLYPAAIESLDLTGFDLVVSSSSAWAHAVRTDDHAVHLNYCHNPFRYAWSEREATLAARDPVSRAVLRPVLGGWRRWDRKVAQRPTRYVANSLTTQRRIRDYFGRESEIVHPPVDILRFAPGQVADHYVLVSELMSHKQIDVAIEAFNRLRLPLVVIGDGPAARRLSRLAGPTVTLVGRVSDAVVARTVASARALIVTAVEEFGIVAVEAQAAGRPVIARAAGGTLETVIDGETGCFWSGGPDELAAAVLTFNDAAIDPRACVSQAERFSRTNFRAKLEAEVDAAFATHPAASSFTGGGRASATGAVALQQPLQLPATYSAVREQHR